MLVSPLEFTTFLQQPVQRLRDVGVMRDPYMVEPHAPKNLRTSVTELKSCYIAEMASTLARDGFRPYGPHRCLTTMISDCLKADFSPEKVSLTPSSLCSTFLQSSTWSAKNFQHPFGPIVSFLIFHRPSFVQDVV